MQVIGPLIFTLFMVIFYFVLINMIIAILGSTHADHVGLLIHSC